MRLILTCVLLQSNKQTGYLECMRNFVDRSKETILAYKSMVRPYLEYCIRVWNPYLVKDVKLIEGVLRRATKMI